MSRSLYDPGTVGRVRAELASSRLVPFSVFSLVVGGMTAALHHEWPFLAYWRGACPPEGYAYECAARGTWTVVAGVGGALLMAGFSLLLHRLAPIRPTLTCRQCDTSGWVSDIEPGGSCPRCGGDRFDYRIWFGGANGAGPRLERVKEYDVAGADLVQRRRETRRGLMRRYY